jgi:hypothetical protein
MTGYSALASVQVGRQLPARHNRPNCFSVNGPCGLIRHTLGFGIASRACASRSCFKRTRVRRWAGIVPRLPCSISCLSQAPPQYSIGDSRLLPSLQRGSIAANFGMTKVLHPNPSYNHPNPSHDTGKYHKNWVVSDNR